MWIYLYYVLYVVVVLVGVVEYWDGGEGNVIVGQFL